MRFHKWLVLLVALMLLVTLSVGCADTGQEPAGESETEGTAEPAGESEDPSAEEQKLQGEGQGFGGSIKVEVTMVDDEITAIEILEHEETEGVSDPAIEQIPDAIIAAQSPEVDAVTGATMTSNGIMEAVANAINQ